MNILDGLLRIDNRHLTLGRLFLEHYVLYNTGDPV
jgi:hypothetical protein